MSKIAQYIVSAAWFEDATLKLQVDHDLLTPELATEINQFWMSADSRLADEGGDPVRAVIRLFGSTAIRFFMADGGARFDGISEGARYTLQVLNDQGEGWPDIGDLGIVIVSAEVPVVDFEDVTVAAV